MHVNNLTAALLCNNGLIYVSPDEIIPTFRTGGSLLFFLPCPTATKESSEGVCGAFVIRFLTLARFISCTTEILKSFHLQCFIFGYPLPRDTYSPFITNTYY